MIFDKIENAEKSYPLSENIKKGLKFIQENNLEKFKDGKYEIDGNDVYISIQSYQTKDEKDSKWEAHKKYTDIQYIIEGEEKIGFSRLEKTTPVTQYDKDKDIFFLEGDGNYLVARKGDFLIFTPEDVHRPSLSISKPSFVKKAVVKLI